MRRLTHECTQQIYSIQLLLNNDFKVTLAPEVHQQ